MVSEITASGTTIVRVRSLILPWTWAMPSSRARIISSPKLRLGPALRFELLFEALGELADCFLLVISQTLLCVLNDHRQHGFEPRGVEVDHPDAALTHALTRPTHLTRAAGTGNHRMPLGSTAMAYSSAATSSRLNNSAAVLS